MRIDRFLYSSIPHQSLNSLITNLVNAFGCEDYCASFPLVFGPSARAEHFLMREQEQVIASLAVLRLTYQMSGKLGHLPCIGSVCVHHSRRGEGLATQLLQNLLAHLAKEGLGEACLFASDERIYHSLGFSYAQPDLLFNLAQTKLTKKSFDLWKNEVSKKKSAYTLEWTEGASLKAEDKQSLWRLLCRAKSSATRAEPKHPEFVISWIEFEAFVSQTPVSVLFLKESPQAIGHQGHSEPECLASLFFGKGADFPDTWHGLSIAADQPPEVQMHLGHQILARALELRSGSQLHFEIKDHVLFPWLEQTFELKQTPSFMISQFSTQSNSDFDASTFVVPSFLSI